MLGKGWVVKERCQSGDFCRRLATYADAVSDKHGTHVDADGRMLTLADKKRRRLGWGIKEIFRRWATKGGHEKQRKLNVLMIIMNDNLLLHVYRYDMYVYESKKNK